MADGSGLTKDQKIQALANLVVSHTNKSRDVSDLDLNQITHLNIKGHSFMVKDGSPPMNSADIEQILVLLRAQEAMGKTPWERGREMAKKVLEGFIV
jgi:hypothetical protein